MAQLLTPLQRAKIGKLVRLRHSALLVELLGDNAVAPSVLKALKAAGLYRAPKPNIIRRAFEYGRESIVEPRVMAMKPKEFNAYLRAHRVELTPQDREAVTVLRRSFRHYMAANAQAYQAKLGAAIVKADKQLTRRAAQVTLQGQAMELERRKAVATIAKDLSTITMQQLGNVDIVTSTEANNAFQDGRAREILRNSAAEGVEDPLVFKRPRIDCCPECATAYLEEDGKTPKVFRLSELMANGSNVGKSRADRVAVLDSFHPWCSCVTHRLLSGFTFDAEGNMVPEGKQSNLSRPTWQTQSVKIAQMAGRGAV